MNIRGGKFCTVLALATMIGACRTNVVENPTPHLEGTLGALAGAPALLRPEDLAKALNIGISTPQLGTAYGYLSENLGLTYRIGANPWGLTQMTLSIRTDQSGAYAVYEELALSLDKTYCLKPAEFSPNVGLRLSKMPMQMPDGGGAYFVNFYDSPARHGTKLRVESADEEDCAKRVSLSIFYTPNEVGPSVVTIIPRDISNRFPAHPPFTATEFWQTLMAMIRLHNGYMSPEQVEQSLHVTFTPITIGYKTIARRELYARDGWYFRLSYGVTGPGYQSVQPGMVPNGQGSILDIEIPSFSFVDDSGKEQCLVENTVEAGLLDAGWKPEGEKKAPLAQAYSQTFKLAGKDANLRIFSQKHGDHHCVDGIRVAGAL